MQNDRKKILEYKKRRDARLAKRGLSGDGEVRTDCVDAFYNRRNKRLVKRNLPEINRDFNKFPIDKRGEMWYNNSGVGSRFDADQVNGEDVQWRTTKNGKHFALNEEGEVVAGPNAMAGKNIKEVKAEAKKNAESKKGSSGSSGSSGASAGAGSAASGAKQGKTSPVKVGTPFSRESISSKPVNADDCRTETKPNSAKKYLDKNGNFTRERQEVHREIIRDKLEGKIPQPEGQRVVTILGGGPASGKSRLRKMAEKALPENSCVGIDPDEMKAALPGYEDMASKSTKAAGYYHEESSGLAKSLYSATLDSGLNAVYDGTGDGSVKSLKKKIDQAHAAGCRAVGSYMTLDIEEALKRNQSRYDHAKAEYEAGRSKVPPRLVAEDEVRKIHGAVTDTSVACAQYFDEFSLYDNSGPMGSEPVLIATGGGGKPITAVDRDKLRAFLDKSRTPGRYVINDKGEVEIHD